MLTVTRGAVFEQPVIPSVTDAVKRPDCPGFDKEINWLLLKKLPFLVHLQTGLLASEDVTLSKIWPSPEQISGFAGKDVTVMEGKGITVTVALFESVQPVEALVVVTV